MLFFAAAAMQTRRKSLCGCRLQRLKSVGVTLAIAFLLLGIHVKSSNAAEEELLGIIALTADKQVAEKLELEPSQKRRLQELIIRREDEGLSLALQFKDLSSDERRKKLEPYRRQSEQMGMQILTLRQRSQLRQVKLAQMGVAALDEPAMAAELELSADQQENIAALSKERSEALRRAPGSELDKVRKEYREKFLAVLDLSQQQEFNDMIAGKRAVPADAARTSSASGSITGAAGAVTGTVKANTAARGTEGDNPLAQSQTQSPEMREGTTDVVADIAAADDAERSATKSVDEQDLPPSNDDAGSGFEPPEFNSSEIATLDGDSSFAAVGERRASTGHLRFAFNYAPWKDVIEWFAEQNGLSLQMDSSPQGTFNYTDPRWYTPQQALDRLNEILLTKGYTLVRKGELLFVINLDDGIPPNLVPAVSLEELSELANSEIASVLFELSSLTAAEAKAEIEPLLREQGRVEEFPRAKRIQVTETVSQLRRIRDVLQAMEDPQTTFGKLDTFDLRFRLADEVLPLIRDMFGMGEDANALEDGSLRISVDIDGRRLLARGNTDRLAQLKDLLKIVDIAGAGGGFTAIQTPQLEVYPIAGADPAAVLRVLQTIIATDPDARLEIDPHTGNLYALARPAEHATIRATIAQAEQDARKIDVIPLMTVDPQSAVLSITKLFGGGGETPDPTAPKIEADLTTRSLLVRATDSQLAQIRQLLQQLGEKTAANRATANRGNVRLLPLGGRETTSALRQIEQIWPAMRPNRIRILTPSAGAEIPAYSPSRRGNEPADQTWQSYPPSVQLEDHRQPGRDDTSPSDEDTRSTTQENTNSTRLDNDRSARRLLPTRSAHIRYAVQREGATGQRGESDADQGDMGAQPRSPAPILIAPGPGGVLIASDDLEALDQLETLLANIASRTSASGREFAVFYLRHARASVVAETLTTIFGGGSSGGGGSGLIGDIASAALGEAGSLVGGLLGGGGGGAAMFSAGVDIVPDNRLNALVVEAKPADLNLVEQLLRILDQPASPEEVLVDAPPRLIPVYNTSAARIATVVQQVYQDRIRSTGGQQRQPSPEELIRALRGSRGGNQGQSKEQQEAEKMSVGIDERSNSLVVRAPDDLFKEVQSLVRQLDDAEVSSPQATEVISLKAANSGAVQRALAALYGNAVSTQGTTPSSETSSTSQPRQGGRNRTQQNGNGTSGQQAEAMRQRAQFFEGIRRFQQMQAQQQEQRGGGRE